MDNIEHERTIRKIEELFGLAEVLHQKGLEHRDALEGIIEKLAYLRGEAQGLGRDLIQTDYGLRFALTDNAFDSMIAELGEELIETVETGGTED